MELNTEKITPKKQGQLALSLLLNKSKDFKNDISKIRRKYNIVNTNRFRASKKYFALKSDISSRATMKIFSKKLQDYSAEFTCDISKLCRNFFIPHLFSRIKKYVLLGDIGDIGWRNSIVLKDNRLFVNVEWDITKTEWGKIWPHIQSIKKSRGCDRTKTIGNFDERLWLLRKESGMIKEIPKAKLKKRMDISQVRKLIKWANKWQESILGMAR